jgi:hypothetical protein
VLGKADEARALAHPGDVGEESLLQLAHHRFEAAPLGKVLSS